MSKLGDYIKTLKNQTESLREVVTAKSGVDCSKMSISECSKVVDNLEVASQDKERYIRPDWYPDIDEIASLAQNISVGSTVYKPYAVFLFNNTQRTLILNTNTNAPTNIYVLSGYVAFSDLCNNDVNSITSDTLLKIDGTPHTWDFTKDIKGPSSEGVRWCILYSSSSPSYAAMYTIDKITPLIEVVLLCGFWNNVTSSASISIKYWHTLKNVTRIANPIDTSIKKIIHEGTNYNNETIPVPPNIVEFIYPAGTMLSLKNGLNTKVFAPTIPFKLSPSINHNLSNCDYIDLTNLADINFSSGVSMYKVKTLILNPNLTSISVNSVGFCNDTVFLEKVKIPNSLISWNGSAYCFKSVPYIELFNDFNLTGLTFTGVKPKKIQWLKDLCIWLKDRTGEEAGSMIIGATNLDNASNIYLTFNPNDKRDITFDGVTSETEGAISITEFITNQLNWTLS